MLFLFKKIWGGLKGLANLVFPVFAKARDLRHPGPGLTWALRLLVLAAILVLLGFVNDWTRLESVLRAPLPILRRIWLPLLFLLIYLMSWLSWWLWELLTADRGESEFPDIDRAWESALVALDHASIDPTQAPLFLIFGSPIGTEEALFNATRLPFEVGRTPRGSDAPLHVYANRDGIYLTCPGASLLARQAALLAEAPPEVASVPAPAMAMASAAAAASPFEPGVLGHGLDRPEGGGGEGGGDRDGGGGDEPPPPSGDVTMPQPRRRPASLLADAAEVDRLSARLQHLCRLIVRSRRPYCPVNGILFLIPFAATESAAEADEIGAICQRDRALARDILQVHCPAFALICDAEEILGFRTFLGRFPEEQREKVLGLDFPLVPIVDESAFAAMIGDGVRWVDQVLIPTLVYRLWRIEEADRKDAPARLRENIQLYQVLTQLHDRRDRIVRALTRALATETPGTTLFGGCYLAATGRDAAREQAFVVGVFRRLLENQNYVSWTSEAIAEDADYRRWARMGWTGIAVFVFVVIALGYSYWGR